MLQFNNHIKVNFIYKLITVLLILTGIYLRFHYFIHNRFMYMDDCSLLLNIPDRNISGLFQSLDNFQKAPPLFLVSAYILYKSFGMSEYVFRIIPFLFSIASVFLFYGVAEKYLKNKISVIVALFLFIINHNLIYYSQSFKQYSSDVFFTLLLLYLFEKFDIKQLTKGKAFLLSLFTGISALYAYPVIFVYPAFILTALTDNFNKAAIKKALFISVPYIIVILYNLILLLKSFGLYEELVYDWKELENCGFLSFDMHSDYISLKQNILYFFGDANIHLFFILFLSGFIIYYFSERKKFFLLTGIFILMLLCSFFQIYPLSERVILFLLPIIILILAKNTDVNFFKKNVNLILNVVVSALLILTFKNYNIEYFVNLYKTPLNVEYTAPREIMKYIIDNKQNDDIFIIVQHSSFGDYYMRLYSNSKDRVLHNYILWQFDDEIYNKDELLSMINGLEKGKTYWLYIMYVPFLDTFYSNLIDYFIEHHISYEEPRKYKNSSMYLVKFIYN